MKKALTMMLVLLSAGVLSAEDMTPQMEKVMVATAPESKASLNAICLAVYEAVKAEPQKASSIFDEVIQQRTTWKASECTAIFRAVLMALPDEKRNLSQYARSYKGGKDGKNAGMVTVGPDPVISEMLDSLYRASLEDGVAETTFNYLIDTPDVVSHDWGAPPSPGSFFVTPDDSSVSR